MSRNSVIVAVIALLVVATLAALPDKKEVKDTNNADLLGSASYAWGWGWPEVHHGWKKPEVHGWGWGGHSYQHVQVGWGWPSHGWGWPSHGHHHGWGWH